MSNIKFSGIVKTTKDWKGNLYDYLQVGDGVDEDMVAYFRDVLPPITATFTLIQIGEPYDHINGRATYSTIVRVDNQWVYAGHCFAGETIHQGN